MEFFLISDFFLITVCLAIFCFAVVQRHVISTIIITIEQYNQVYSFKTFHSSFVDSSSCSRCEMGVSPYLTCVIYNSMQ